ncbi:putative O-methyltransferase YrrM [Isoptericola chiayiensis]|nr:putative O-methyltransferase YrrM [Isoptericola chiayiensis]
MSTLNGSPVRSAQRARGADITTGIGAHDGPSAAWAFSETYLTEDVTLLRARERGEELGCRSISTGTGALLRTLAAALQARAVVELGTGSAVASLWLLRGMAPDGVLTTIDADGEHLRAAKAAFADEGVPAHRTRTIARSAAEVLPRLTDGAYDLVVVSTEPHALPGQVTAAVRLLRPGGMLVITDALLGGRVADPALRDEETAIVREVTGALRDDDRLAPAVVPVGEGVLLAVRR